MQRRETTLSSAIATFSPFSEVSANRVRHSRVNWPDYRQHSDLAPIRQPLGDHEIHAPALVRPAWPSLVRCVLSLRPLLALLCTHDQPLFRVQPIDPLGIYFGQPSRFSNTYRQPPVAIAYPAAGQLPQSHPHRPPGDHGDVRHRKVARFTGISPATRRAAGSVDEFVRPIPPARDAPEALQLFSDDLLQDMAVQTQVRYQALKFAILLAQLTKLAQLA